ncbi:MAG TPA: DUF998 domain-containing protein [Balneolaceae bacterium]|nr:DUF998 domain-containing protein [Balneolaceae bacterium]
MDKTKALSYSGIAGAALFIVTTIIGGSVFDGYSHISNYISESYAYGTTYGHWLRWIGYIPSGLFIALFSILAGRKFKGNVLVLYGFIGFGILYGLFTSLVSVFPCDFGCNRDYGDASISQFIHSILSLFTYLLTPIMLFMIGVGFKRSIHHKVFSRLSIFLSFTALAFGLLFLTNANSPIAGLLQRITESVYLFWIICISVFLNKDFQKTVT